MARHGARWDYLQRDAGKGREYISNAARPFDPPLSPQGLKQASRLGSHLSEKLASMKLPPIVACYASPFLRCRQTACQAVEALNSIADDAANASTEQKATKPLTVKIELGLTESLNESWYRSWALPGADSTWGFVSYDDKTTHKRRRHLQEFAAEELHPLSKVPAQELLDWQDVMTHTLHEEDKLSNELLERLQDMTYKSRTTIAPPFALHPKVLVESKNEQMERMHEVVQVAAEQAVNESATDSEGQTILLVSHGGPVTHLYTKLTGNNWSMHGDSKYCCYSIYEMCHDDGDNTNGQKKWKPLVVNQSKYLDDLWSDSTANV